MQNDRQDSKSPPSRRTIIQQEQTEGGYVYRDEPHSSQPRHSSQVWTSTPSFSSQSSQEHDPSFRVPVQDPRLPSVRASFAQPTSRTFASQASTIYQPYYSGGSATISSTDPYERSTEVQYPISTSQHITSSGLDFQGPPLPYPYPPVAGFGELPVSHFVEPPVPRGEPHAISELSRGRSSTPRHPPRTLRISPNDAPYPLRRPSHDTRTGLSMYATSQTQYRAPSQPPSRPPSRPPTRSPSRPPHVPYRTASDVQYYPPSSNYPEPHSPERFFGSRQYQSAVSGRAPSQYAHESGYGTEQPSPFSPPAMRPLLHRTPAPQQGRELPFGRTSASTLPARRPTGAQPLPNVGELTSIPSSYSFELQPPPPPPGPIRTQRPQRHESSSLSPVHHTRSTASGRRTSRPLVEQPKRRRPPDPYTSYAHLLADIINQHPRKKMTLQDIYLLLKRRYSEHFPDDGVDDTKSGSHGGGWRNTVRHALSVNQWFKKQHRTDTDAKLDERNPNRYEPPPMDADFDNEGRPIIVAPATRRERSNLTVGGDRPLKGGYWFIREKYKEEAARAVAKDKERYNKQKQEEEERAVRESRQPSPARFPGRWPSREIRGREHDTRSEEEEEQRRRMDRRYERGGGPAHYSRYRSPG